jgi:antitoxin ParD1/3/4
MSTRNVVLTERQESMIDALVQSGRYQNASEVMREGLRLIEQRETEDSVRLEALREAARSGMAALDRGDFKEFDDPDALVAYLSDLADRVVRPSDQ